MGPAHQLRQKSYVPPGPRSQCGRSISSSAISSRNQPANHSPRIAPGIMKPAVCELTSAQGTMLSHSPLLLTFLTGSDVGKPFPPADVVYPRPNAYVRVLSLTASECPTNGQ